MFFRKKRNDPDGMDRISRMIEGRETDDGDEDFFEEEEVVMLRGERTEAVSRDITPARAPATPREPVARRDAAAEVESVTMVRPSLRDAVTAPSSLPAIATPAPAEAPATAFAPPREAPRPSLPELNYGAGRLDGASLIAKDAVWEGKLVCSGNVRVEGHLRGEIETSETVLVAAEARVEGVVRARNVTLAGEIEGEVRCQEKLEIMPGGAARGEIDTGTLVVHEGAHIDSRFQMRREAGAR